MEIEKLFQLIEQDVKYVHHTPEHKVETHTVLLMLVEHMKLSSQQEIAHAAHQAQLLMSFKEIASIQASLVELEKCFQVIRIIVLLANSIAELKMTTKIVEQTHAIPTKS